MSKIKELIEKGKSQGYLESQEIKEYLPAEITEQEQIEDILAMINDMGIEVRTSIAEIINLFEKE